jgi:hypothetical protein
MIFGFHGIPVAPQGGFLPPSLVDYNPLGPSRLSFRSNTAPAIQVFCIESAEVAQALLYHKPAGLGRKQRPTAMDKRDDHGNSVRSLELAIS